MIRVLMVSDVYFPRINGVSTSMETFRRALAGLGIDVRLIVPRYGDEADEAGVIRIPGRRLPNDPEDRLLPWRAMHRRVREAAADCDLIHVQTPFVAHYAGLAAARHHGLPMYIAAPGSTVDLSTAAGDDITIEERDHSEVFGFGGVRTAPEDIDAENPAFDVTPHENIRAIITEKGIISHPDTVAVTAFFDKHLL